MKMTDDQQLAVDSKGTNIIVSAGAGSGKTAVLTQRVGRILNDGEHVNSLLLLTFTKAAADEMKERIRKYIKKNPELIGELDLLDSSYITTFDSFSLSIVKKYHYLLNISNSVSISDSNVISLKKKEFINLILDRYYQEEDVDFCKLIGDFCVKNDDGVVKILLKIADEIDKLPNKYEYLDSVDSLMFSDESLNSIKDDYSKIVMEKIRELKLIVTNFRYVCESDYFDKVEAAFSSLVNAKNVEEVLLYSNVSIPRVPPKSSLELKDYKDKILSPCIKELKELLEDDYSLIGENILKTRGYVSIIVKILKEYFSLLDKYKLDNEVFDFQDIALMAISIVRDFEEAREEIKNSFYEIMIDEYQDTNDIQETFISYISNNNVYMVGDIKQGIYRFRNANPYIFKNKYDSYSNNDGGMKIDLLANFRSRCEVLNNINRIFCGLMDDYIGGAEYIVSHQMDYGNKSYDSNIVDGYDYNMRVLNYNYDKESDYSKEEIETFSILKDIKDKMDSKFQVFDKDTGNMRNCEYSDFCIIIDKSKNFNLIKNIFEFSGVPLLSYKDDKMNESRELSLVINGLKLINSINGKNYDSFRYSFMALGRSFLYEMSDNELLKVFNDKSYSSTNLYSDIKSISDRANTMNVKMIVREFIDVVKFYDKLYLVDDVDKCVIRMMSIVSLIDSFADNCNSIDEIITNLDKILDEGLPINSDSMNEKSNAVNLMTVHKSKGLEYPICYFMSLYGEFNLGDIKDRFKYSSKYGIITPYFEEGIRQSVLNRLMKREYIKEEISERIRLFYVALTRAREQIVILLPNDDYIEDIPYKDSVVEDFIRIKYRCFKDMMESINKYSKNYNEKVNLSEIGLTKDYLYKKNLSKLDSDKNDIVLNVNEIDISKEKYERISFSKKVNSVIDKDSYNNIQLGLKIHGILEFIDFDDLSLITDEFIYKKIDMFVNSDLMKNYKLGKIYREYQFSTEDSIGIIDLMIEYDDYIDIIDYKLKGIDDVAYNDQLNGYRKHIESRFNKKVRTYLYSLMDGKYREVQ